MNRGQAPSQFSIAIIGKPSLQQFIQDAYACEQLIESVLKQKLWQMSNLISSV